MAQPEKAKEEAPPTVIDKDIAALVQGITELSVKRLNMRDELKRLEVWENPREQIEELALRRDEFKAQIDSLANAPDTNREKLNTIQTELDDNLSRIRETSGLIASRISEVDKWIDFWATEEQKVEEWWKGLGSLDHLPSVQKQINQLSTVIEGARVELDKSIQPLLALLEQAGELQISLHEMNLEIDLLFADKFSFSSRTTPFFSQDYFSQFDSELLLTLSDKFKLFLRPDIEELQTCKIQILVCFILFCLLTSNLNRFRPVIAQYGEWSFLAKKPYSLAALISLAALLLLCSHLNSYWFSLIIIAMIVCLILLADTFTTTEHAAKAVSRSLLLLLLLYILKITQVPILLERLYTVSVSATVLARTVYGYFTSNSFRLRMSLTDWILYLYAAVAAVALYAEIRGKSDFAYYLLSSTLKTVFCLFTVWVVYESLRGLLSINFGYSSSSTLSKYADHIAKMIRPMLQLGSVLLASVGLLLTWQVYSNAVMIFYDVEKVSFVLGDNVFTFGVLGGALTVLYLAYWIAKLIEIAVLEGAFPGGETDRGVQVTISKFLGYAIIFFGGICALAILGVNMTNITILGSAIGVGIGFGLQNIFNNFASGLILLFERPIKVGDVIKVGNETATVRELGLRATVVETYDNAEIVIPNSTLTSTNVTNWTLGKRQVRAKITIGVAYGSDISQVLDVLEICALEHPLVLSEPRPLALFREHGASSLDFDLYIYVPDVDSRLTTTSELNMAINEALEEAGIDIPYPQRDLHLKTVSRELRAAMSSADQVTSASGGPESGTTSPGGNDRAVDEIG